MPSTYDSLLRLELQATGENENTWGDKANTDFELIAQAIAGHVSVAVGGSGDYTLSTANAATDEARRAYLTLSGTLTGDRTVVVPATSKLYVIRRNTTGSYDISIKPTGGTAVTLPTTSGMSLVACDGVVCRIVADGNALNTTTGGTVNAAIAVSVSSSTSATPALRITQTGVGPALLVEDAASDNSPLVINASGELIIGSSVPYSLDGYVNSPFQIHRTNYSAGPLFVTWDNTAPGPILQLGKSRGSAVGTYATVSVDDLLGQVVFAGDTGTKLIESAGIAAVVDATVSGSIVPSRLVMWTQDSAGTITNHFTVDKDGNTGLGTMNPQQRLHLSSGNIQIVDAVLSAPSGSAPLFAARAWGVANGPTLVNGGNVASITNNGTGDYTVSFTNAMPDTNYSLTIWGGHNVGYYFAVSRLETGQATTSFRVQFMGWNGAAFDDMDPSIWSFAVYR